MTPEEFNDWLADMKTAGLGKNGIACARLLGISANSVVEMRRRGADRRTALACRALLHKLEPYGAYAPAPDDDAPHHFPWEARHEES